MEGWDSVDLLAVGTGLIGLLTTIIGAVVFGYKNNKKQSNKILDMLEKQVENLRLENQELRNKVDRLQNEVIELSKKKYN